MQTCLNCLPCLVQQSLVSVTRIIADPQRQEAAMREIMTLLAGDPWHCSPPELVYHIQRIIRQWSGQGDPYREAKRAFNVKQMKKE